MSVIVDASAIAAVLFDEPEAAPVLASIAGPLLAPSLLRYEMASVCTTKLQRQPRQANLTLRRYELFSSLNIELVDPEWETLPVIASQWGLSAYDAAYLQLALAREAPLVTLDARLARVYDSAVAQRR